jgi:hypothetical protein
MWRSQNFRLSTSFFSMGCVVHLQWLKPSNPVLEDEDEELPSIEPEVLFCWISGSWRPITTSLFAMESCVWITKSAFLFHHFSDKCTMLTFIFVVSDENGNSSRDKNIQQLDLPHGTEPYFRALFPRACLLLSPACASFNGVQVAVQKKRQKA